MKSAAVLVAAATILCCSAAAHGQAVVVGADVGISRFAQETNPGFGFNIYPGYVLGPLTLEAQFGYHSVSPADERGQALGLHTTYAPVLAGGRLGVPMGLITPWVGFHGGFARVTSLLGDPSRRYTTERREWEPAFDAGVGVDLGLGNRLGLGAGVWYHRVSKCSRYGRRTTCSLR